MRRRGTEDSRTEPGIMRPLIKKSAHKPPVLTKDEQRGVAVRAFMEWRARRKAPADD